MTNVRRVEFGEVYRVTQVDEGKTPANNLKWKQIAVLAVHNIGELALAVRKIANQNEDNEES